MADWPGIYNTGTATVAANGTVVTFQNAGNLAQAVRVGDRFGSHRGLPIRISEIGPATGLTASQVRLAFAWPGPAQAAAAYEIMLTPYDSGWREALQRLIDLYGATPVLALAGLQGSNNAVPVFTGPNTMGLLASSVSGRSILAGTAVQGRAALGTIRFEASSSGSISPPDGLQELLRYSSHGASTTGAPTTSAGGVFTLGVPFPSTPGSGIARSVSLGTTFGGTQLWWTGYAQTGETAWRRFASWNENVTFGTITGNGSGLTNLSATALASGTVPSARLSGNYNIGINTTSTINGGTVRATYSNNDRWGLLESRNAADQRGFFLGWGNGSTQVNFTLDAASQLAFTGGTYSFAGNLSVTGSLSKGSGTFLIDHPLDPLNRDLAHGFVEAPRYDLIYRGVATLEDGRGLVDIDAASNMSEGTFAALTTNAVVLSLQNQTGFARVRPGPIEEGGFEILCEDDTCADTIAWMVVAERNDPFVRSGLEHNTDTEGRFIPEREKPE